MKKFLRILFGLLLFLGSIYLLLACFSYHITDASWNTASAEPIQNWMGKGGAVSADILMQLFGKLNYLIPVAFLVFGLFLLRNARLIGFRITMFTLALLAACWLMGGSAVIKNLTGTEGWTKIEAGGFIGFYLRQWLPAPSDLIKVIGWVLVLLLLIFSLKVPVFLIYRKCSATANAGAAFVKSSKIPLPKTAALQFRSKFLTREKAMSSETVSAISSADNDSSVNNSPVQRKEKKSFLSALKRPKKSPTPHPHIEPTFSSFAPFDSAMGDNADSYPTETKQQEPIRKNTTPTVKPKESFGATADKNNIVLPSSDLLGKVIASTAPALSKDKMGKTSRELEQVLSQFGVNGKVIGAQCGPVVTLYEFEPAPGIKTSRIIALADDVAMKMRVPSVRIAVIPGMNALGIEMPNPKRETVYIRELIESVKFQGNNGLLPLILGKDIGGVPVFADLAKMPHLLVAGTTGSGKSVAINTMILSLLYRFTPAECRLIMVDPKMVELSVYNQIPHLLTPVVIEPEKAVVALKWAVREMEDRYRSMMHLGTRNIESYNQKVLQAARDGKTITRRVQTGFDPETGKPIFEEQNFDLTPFPFIVIIVDEMADLMGQCGKEVDPLIQRLAQKSRAVGIHLILATQRPSVDVVTGTIKSNFPSRISFQVRSKIDSRTILDEPGAEQLLGRGDMLYMPAGQKPQRVHGPFVSDDDVQAVVKHWENQAEPEYLDAVITDVDGGTGGSSSNGVGGGESDGVGSGDLYDQAVAIVLRDKKPTISYIQRQLRIGYNKAADLIDRMEAEGIVSKTNIAGKREILVPTDNAS